MKRHARWKKPYGNSIKNYSDLMQKQLEPF